MTKRKRIRAPITRQKTCLSCGKVFPANNRKSHRCPDCYPRYRQAVNLHGAAKYRATKGGMDFDLTPEWVEERLRKPCPRTGVLYTFNDPSKNMGDRGPFGPSLDKIDPTKGYTMDNVQVVCWWYNVAKQRFTDEEVFELCKLVVTNQSS